MMKKIMLYFVTGCILLAVSTLVVAAEPVGIVISAQGNVQAQDQTGKTRALKRRDNIFVQEVITTGTDSSVILRLNDDSIASVRASSRYQVQELNYNSAQPKNSRNIASLTQGALLYISGQPEHGEYKIKTPVATIGIRGTVVYANVRTTKASSSTAVKRKKNANVALNLVVFEGSVVLSVPTASKAAAFGTEKVEVAAGSSVTVAPDATGVVAVASEKTGASVQELIKDNPAAATAVSDTSAAVMTAMNITPASGAKADANTQAATQSTAINGGTNRASETAST